MQRQAKAPAVRVIKALVAIGLLVGVFFVRSSAQTARGPIRRRRNPGEVQAGRQRRREGRRAQSGGRTPVAEIPRTGVQRVRVAPRSGTAAIARYRRNPNVLYAEPNFIRRIPMPVAHGAGSPVVPGDYHFDEQWALTTPVSRSTASRGRSAASCASTAALRTPTSTRPKPGRSSRAAPASPWR